MKPLKFKLVGLGKGNALPVVMVLGAAATIVLAGTMRWTAANAKLIDRNIAYQNAVFAAEAATEKVLSRITTEFAKGGPAAVAANLDNYKKHIPNPDEHSRWYRYKFKNGKGKNDEVAVDLVAPWQPNTPLLSQFRGLKGYAATYRIRANAQDLLADAEAAVYQDVQLAVIPLFQFAVFYNIDLEVHPGAPMEIRGRVHSNRDIYAGTDSKDYLTFWEWVTASSQIYHKRKYTSTPYEPVYKAGRDANVSTLNMPIGTNNSPEAVRAILEIPPQDENENSPMGQQRFYNNCDVVILVTNGEVSIRGGGVCKGEGSKIKWQYATNWLSTNATFYDQREQKTVVATEIDIGKFIQWATNTDANVNPIGNTLAKNYGRTINSVYVADLRPMTASTLPAVRLVNGAILPPSGLTVATPNPLYVKGNYNAYGASVGTTNTANTKPAALLADAITILSGSWNDANSTAGINSRIPSDTTVNAAFLAGIVETVGSYYSGGLENFPRFLENWSGRTLTYNGSMVVMFPSKYATNRWPGTGTVYNPPTRKWSFDVNFYDPDKLPPLCPSVRAVIRYKWANIAPTSL